MNYRGYSDLSILIKKNLHQIQSKQIDLIIGIPRSGMVPAYILAMYLRKDCCDLETFLKRRYTLDGLQNNNTSSITQSRRLNILLVDDCISSGRSLKHSLSQIPDDINLEINILCIYSSEKTRNDVDLFFEYLPGVSVFEWNIFHSFIIKNSLLNIEGVLCAEPEEDINYDEEKYRDYVLNAPLLFFPTGKIGCLVTNRLEKYREETETWLKKNNIEYGSLIMASSSLQNNKLAKYKAATYKLYKKELCIEHKRDQSIRIYQLTKKPVYCVESNELFSRSEIISALYGSKSSRNIVRNNLISQLKKLPKPIYIIPKYIYRLLMSLIRDNRRENRV